MSYDLPDHPVIQNMERTGYPNGKEPEYPRCPICGEECEDIYKDKDLNIVFCKEGFVEGERDIIGLDDDDLKCLGALISAVSGGAVKWESEAQ